MKTIAMTGASGFIGQHLLRHYLEEGAKVVAFVPDPENMEEYKKYPNFELVKAFFEDFVFFYKCYFFQNFLILFLFQFYYLSKKKLNLFLNNF